MQVATHEATLNQQWEFNKILLTSIVIIAVSQFYSLITDSLIWHLYTN